MRDAPSSAALPAEPGAGPGAEPGAGRWWPWAVGAGVLLVLATGVFACLGGGSILGLAALRPLGAAAPAPSVAEAPPASAPLAAPAPAALVAPTSPSPPAPAPVAAAAPTVARVAAPRPRPAAVERVLAPPPPAPPRETFEAVVAPHPTAPEAVVAAPAPVAVAPEAPLDLSHLDEWSDAAFAGHLDPDARALLERVPPSDPEFTRAGTLVFLDAKARGDADTRDRTLAALLALPENAYNPVLLVERAQLSAERRQWDAALADAKLAELHWARIPSELVWSRKTMIYEIEAVANTGLFYDSEGEDTARLDAAIRSWERYREHVAGRPAPELVQRADESLATLRDARERLE